MSDMYGITGFFAGGPTSGNKTPFGGLFFREQTGDIYGGLVDKEDVSRIWGTFVDEGLHFVKQYLSGRKIQVNYGFKKRKGGLWVGEWTSQQTGRGRAVCWVNLDYSDTSNRPSSMVLGDLVEAGMGRAASWDGFIAGLERDARLHKVE